LLDVRLLLLLACICSPIARAKKAKKEAAAAAVPGIGGRKGADQLKSLDSSMAGAEEQPELQQEAGVQQEAPARPYSVQEQLAAPSAGTAGDAVAKGGLGDVSAAAGCNGCANAAAQAGDGAEATAGSEGGDLEETELGYACTPTTPLDDAEDEVTAALQVRNLYVGWRTACCL